MKPKQPSPISTRILIAIIAVIMLTACAGNQTNLSPLEGARAGDLVGLEECTYKSNNSS